MIENGIEIKKHEEYGSVTYETYYGGGSKILTSALARILGLRDGTGVAALPTLKALVTMNDNGWSFKGIAGHLKRHAAAYFLDGPEVKRWIDEEYEAYKKERDECSAICGPSLQL
jgi:hypothetical protein